MPDSKAIPGLPGALARRWLWSRKGTVADSKGSRPRDMRKRIAIWAIVIGFIVALFDIALPIEDTARAARAAIRSHDADQSVIVVIIDDSSLNELGVNDPKRSDDAKLIDNLFSYGARRVFFDRAYAEVTVPAEDKKFAEALKRHRPNVYLGAMAEFTQYDGSTASFAPNPIFRPHVNVAVMNGYKGVLGLSTKFPGQAVVDGQIYPSLSAALAGREPFEGRYRVDFALDHASIPTASYADILRGRVDPARFAGRDIVIAPSSRITNDYHPVPFGDPIPGATIQVLGSKTLRNGLPRDWSWYPVFALAALVIIVQSRRPHPSHKLMVATIGIISIMPIALDTRNLNVDVVPGLLMLGIAWVRLHKYAQQTYRGSTGIKRIETLHVGKGDAAVDVVALKIRNFATISSSLSPDEIDELLMKAQAMLKATEHDGHFSFEKDTFVWLRPRAPLGELENHVRGLHALFRTSITIGSHKPDVASSIGIDTNYESSLRERTENAMQCAEDAAHLNKIYMVAEAELAADRTWRLQMLSELESALANGEVEVLFQPKVSLANEAIVGAEALMRWNHPQRGPIDPAVVIASAEEHNRVDMITRFVLDRSMREAQRAIAVNPSFKVAINISALDLRDPAFVGSLEKLVAKHRFPVANLVLEITETAPIENDPIVTRNLESLKRIGIRLSVDDFGIGHASLHYLRQIPADEVKIDRSFVIGIENSLEDRALVRTAIEMIHSLGRTAVAEGVENQATVDMLRVMGCDVAQGYFFYRPVIMDTLLSRLQDSAMAA